MSKKLKNAFTLTELVVTMVTAIIVILTIGVILADSHRGWNTTYNKAYSEVVTGGYVARKAFDAVVRKSSRAVSGGDWLEVYYFADADSPAIDRYVRFYTDAGQLNIEYGTINPRQTTSTHPICGMVSNCVFYVFGRYAQMLLTLDDSDGTGQTSTIVAAAYMHN